MTDDKAKAPTPGSTEDRAATCHPDQGAGQDSKLAERLERDPSSESAKLDVELDGSMDASDPPSQTQPSGS